MRPLKLTMSAFGSYAGEETVDFSGMEQGIFLITGDTGAGKTTVFDGIVYALYDRTSGGIRDGNMMRSAYADLRTPTFVELEFLCRGERYRIVRNPDYTRESLRKDKNGNAGKTREKSKAEFYLPDGSMFRGNKKEVNRRVEELLGMDARQFMQMAMIAQGDFLKLLHAKSEERKEIFSKIFDTGIYGRIQEDLRKMEKEGYVRLKEKERACQEQISRILCPEDFGQAEELHASAEAEDLDTVIRLLRDLTKAEESRERRLAEKKEEAVGRMAALRKKLEILESLCVVLEMRRKQDTWLLENLPREREYLEREDVSAGRLKETEETYRQLLQGLEEEQKEAEKEQEVLKEKLREIEGLRRLWEEALQCRKIQKENEEKRNRANSRYQEKWRLYEAANETFFREQAGILAENLEDGFPCPVCGSRSHPKKAALSPSAPTQEQVQAAKREMKAAEMQREQVQKVCQSSAQEYQAALGSLNQEGRRLLGESFDAGSRKWQEQAEEAIKRAGAELAACQRACEEKREKGKQQARALEAEQKSHRSAFQRAKAERENFIRQAERIRGEAKAAGEQEERLLKEWTGYHDKESGEQKPLEGASLEFIRDQTEILKGKELALEEEKKHSEHMYQECHVRSRSNKKTLEVLISYQKEYEELQERFVMVRHLSQTAGGGLAGSAKLDFESYIQRRYFEQIIRRANQRLLQMSSGQFVLKCKDVEQLGNQGKVGLDLDVYSFVTGSARDVKTLSGGESFMAALAMALGLADVIQDSVGAIRLDTLFIDEGFGSLDDHSREQALRVLHELAGEKRLIGIISHVTELKEQIEQKLVVTKGKKGSHVAWVREG